MSRLLITMKNKGNPWKLVEPAGRCDLVGGLFWFRACTSEPWPSPRVSRGGGGLSIVCEPLIIWPLQWDELFAFRRSPGRILLIENFISWHLRRDLNSGPISIEWDGFQGRLGLVVGLFLRIVSVCMFVSLWVLLCYVMFVFRLTRTRASLFASLENRLNYG